MRLFLATVPPAIIILLFAYGALLFSVPAHGGAAPHHCDITGRASWYGTESGDTTATGEHFDGTSLTAAMPTHTRTKLRLGQRYRVYYGSRHVDVRINDTGGFAKYGRVIDLSRAAALAIGLVGPDVGTVCLERLP